MDTSQWEQAIVFDQLYPELRRFLVIRTKEQERMRTMMHNTHLPLCRPSTHIDQQGEMTVFQCIAHPAHKLWLPLALDAKHTHRFTINLLRPIPFPIGASTDDIMINRTFP